jgi:hypothetical protein
MMGNKMKSSGIEGDKFNIQEGLVKCALYALTLAIYTLAFVASIGLFVSIILSAAILLAGLANILLGTWTLLHLPAFRLWPLARADDGLSSIVKGLELLFVAPVVGVTFPVAATFLMSQLEQLLDILRIRDKDPNVKSMKVKSIASFLDTTKVSFVGFMAALLLANLIGLIVSSVVNPAILAGHVVGVSLCLGYYWLIAQRGRAE